MTVSGRAPRIVFRVGSGPRRGYGHVVRAIRLASALDGRIWLSVDGPTPPLPLAQPVAALTGGIRSLDRVRPDLLVIDTPVVADGRRWLRAARRRGIATASIHDRGLAPLESDLAFDGSLAARGPVRGARRSLVGPRFMVVDPAVLQPARPTRSDRVVISLGGGSRLSLARRIGERIVRRRPDVEVAIAAGFNNDAGRQRSAIHWIGPQRSLAAVLGSAAVAVVAGGVTLYEAAALGVPTVAVAVVPAQEPTLAAFARAGAAVAPAGRPGPERIAEAVVDLLGDRRQARRLAARGRTLVDGKGTERVARALAQMAEDGA